MDDKTPAAPIKRISLIRLDIGMLSGTTPSACASSLLPSLIQNVIRAIDGHKLKYIDITISGIWEKEENTAKKEKKTL